MPSLVRHVVVVGGGTAGWLTALHLKTMLGPGGTVTVIESPNVPTIGVGEGTQPMIRRQLKQLMVDEDDMMRRCGGSFKNGIRFVGWDTRQAEYLHPFFSGDPKDVGAPSHPMHVWHEARRRGLTRSLMTHACWPESRLMDKRKAPYGFKDGARTPPMGNFALHIDAARLGLYLRDVAKARGVRHIADDVAGVRRDDHGIIALRTKEHGEISGELYVDCTGFARVLIGALAERDEFTDYKQYLLNDSAVAGRVPYAEGPRPKRVESSTTSTALGHGWVWEVPLQDRVGAGYVFSSPFVSDEQAERDYRAFVRHKLGVEDFETRVIKFRTGCLERQWIGNCVSIGLSAGFIEPLEATGIALITYGIERLVELWPIVDRQETSARRFNETMVRSFEWIRDFIVMHFCLSDRDDTEFWRAVRQPDHIPASVPAKIDEVRERWPLGEYLRSGPGYTLTEESVACILAGFGVYPAISNGVMANLSDDVLRQLLLSYHAKIEATDAACMDHAAYLRRLAEGTPMKPMAPQPANQPTSLTKPLARR